METKIVNTAAVTASANHGEKQEFDFRIRLSRYLTSKAVFHTMLKKHYISQAEYQKSCDILARKYGLSLGSIFR